MRKIAFGLIRDIMDSISFFFLISIITVLQLLSALAPISADDNRCYNNYGNFTSGSSYGENRDKILSSLYTDPTAVQGFYSGSLGNTSDDTVYVLSFCRRDCTLQQCIDCLNATAVSLIQTCPNHKKALSWGAADSYPPCTIRYSNESIYGTYETEPKYIAINPGNITMNQTEFDQVWLNLTRGLAAKAAKGSLQLKYATGERILPNDETIYALVQCSPDMSESLCQSCLLGSINDYQACCRGKRGGPVRNPSCIFRWDMYPFYTSSTPTSPPPPSLTPPPSPNTTQGKGNTGGNDSSHKTIIIIVILVVAVASLICIFVLVKRRKKRNPEQKVVVEGEMIGEISNEDWLHFDLETVKAATDDFSDTNKLGRGGFGTVYKGKLPNEREIAVKRLSTSSGQGQLEFRNEVMLLAKLQHRNLVRLLGFCLEGIERLLIYEHVPNSSLDHFLFDPIKRTLLNWETRYKIITGIARGILYLHEDSRLRVIHRDLKASNILLDKDMNAKIADFGMAKLFSEDQTRSDTSRVVGTYGYMAPEYIMHGNFSVKTDVFSFGVLVLEIVSGKSNNRFNNQDNGESDNIESLISYTWRNWREGTLSNIIDPTLKSGSTSEMARCIHIGLLCVEQHIANRPTMATVVMMLNSHSMTLKVPTQPAFISGTYMESDSSTSLQRRSRASAKGDLSKGNNASDQVSNNDVTISEVYPR